MHSSNRLLPAVTVVLALAAPAGGRAAEGLELSAGYDYSSGDYGQDVTTEIEYLPLSLAWTAGPWRAEVTVPYIRVTGNGTVVPGAGSPMVFDSFGSGLFGMGGGGGSTTSTRSETRSGLGDVTTRLGYAFAGGNGSFYELSGKIKFGTADEDQGLGTGENDYTLQFDGVIGDGALSPYFTLGYLVTGDSAAFSYRDVPYGSLGLLFRLGEGASAGLGYDYRRATVQGSDDQQQLSAYLGWRFTPDLSATVSALAGFTDASPDYGAGFRLTTAF